MKSKPVVRMIFRTIILVIIIYLVILTLYGLYYWGLTSSAF